MRNDINLAVCILLTSTLTLLPLKLAAQVVGFYPCIDDSGNAALCSGEIPEKLISEETYTRIPGERGCGSGSLSWSQNGYSEIPGIHWAFLHTYCKSGREIVIWTDFENGFFGGSARANANGRKLVDGDSSQSASRNGDRTISGMMQANALIAYQFEVIGDRSGGGYINDTLFDLEKGGLFLIASNGPAIKIRQVSYNLANISSEDIKLLAIQHPEIRSFFEDFHK